MKRTNLTSLLLIFSLSAVGASVLAAPESKPSGKDLLIAVVSNKYPAEPAAHGCDEFIPAFTQLKVDGGCRSITKRLPKIAFIGDSHIAHYRPEALREFQTLNSIVISQTGCFPFAADSWHDKMFQGSSCASQQKAVLDYLSNAATIQTVVLSSRWWLLMAGPDFKTSDEDTKTFITNGKQFIATLLKTGKQVLLMRDVPDLDFSIETCYNIRPVRLGKAEIRPDCSMIQASFEPRRQLQNAALDEILKPYPAVKVYDPVPLFCQDGRCKASDGALPYYLNHDHVNNYGAQFVFKDFVPKFFPELNPGTKAQ